MWLLALNLRWSWRPETRELFRSIDPELWDALEDNPKELLQRVHVDRLRELAADDGFLGNVRKEADNLDHYLQEPLWFQKTYSKQNSGTGRSSTDPIAAYFSMEFGIDPTLPIYSGGLGVLAGDHMKSASDLGIPLIGVGLLYSYGYFSQSLSGDGWQEENYEYHDPRDLPVSPVLDKDGKQITVTVAFPDHRDIVIALWVAEVGRVPLLLLDTNIEENPADLRDVTDRLYGGDSEHRIKQELVLGVGGVRAVNAFCDARGLARPRVAHLNEGPTSSPPTPPFPLVLTALILSWSAATWVQVMRNLATCVRTSPSKKPSNWVWSQTRIASTWLTWACGCHSMRTASLSCTVKYRVRCSPACTPATSTRKCRLGPSLTVCTCPPG